MNEAGPRPAWYYRPWVVLVFLFLVLGPFGLPLVYRSPGFNKAAKILLTLLMIPYTWYLVTAAVEVVQRSGEIYAKYRGVLW